MRAISINHIFLVLPCCLTYGLRGSCTVTHKPLPLQVHTAAKHLRCPDRAKARHKTISRRTAAVPQVAIQSSCRSPSPTRHTHL